MKPAERKKVEEQHERYIAEFEYLSSVVQRVAKRAHRVAEVMSRELGGSNGSGKQGSRDQVPTGRRR